MHRNDRKKCFVCNVGHGKYLLFTMSDNNTCVVAMGPMLEGMAAHIIVENNLSEIEAPDGAIAEDGLRALVGGDTVPGMAFMSFKELGLDNYVPKPGDMVVTIEGNILDKTEGYQQ